MSPQRSTSRSKTVEILQRSDCLNIDDEEIRDLDNMLFPEGGWQAWMTIVGAYVNRTYLFIYSSIIMSEIQVFSAVCNFWVRRWKF